MQAHNPWDSFNSTLSTVLGMAELGRNIKKDRREEQRTAEKDEREKAMFKHGMLKFEYQEQGLRYKALDNVKDHKSYNEWKKFQNNYATQLEKDGQTAKAEQIRNEINQAPLYDGELYGGASPEGPESTWKGSMGSTRPNPDSKFMAWKQDKQLQNIAMFEILGADVKKDEVKFGEKTMTKFIGGKKKTRKVTNAEDFAASEGEGYQWGESEDVKETPEAKGARELGEKKDLESFKSTLKPPGETTDEKEAAKFKYAKQLETFKSGLKKNDAKKWGDLQVADENSPLKAGTAFMQHENGEIKIFNQDEKGTLTENQVQQSIVELSYSFDEPEKKAAELTIAFDKKRKAGMDTSAAWASVLEDIYGSGGDNAGGGADYSVLWSQ